MRTTLSGLPTVALWVLLLSGVCGAAGCSSEQNHDGARQDGQLDEGEGSSGGSDTTLDIPASGGDSGNDDECQRDVSLQPVTLGEPQPFDLVIVADHSASLAWSRDALAAGLQDLLTHVRGRSVRVFLLTPTQYGASSELSPLPATTWQDPQTAAGYAPAVTVYNPTCTNEPCPDPDDEEPYVLDGTWDFVTPETDGSVRLAV